jgi:hypothetical protein
MANIDRNVAGAAVELALNGTMSSGTPTDGQTFVLNGDVTGWPTTWGVVLLDPDGTQEKILYSVRSGNTVTVATGGRGFDGTAATNHGNNAKARHFLDADLVTRLIAHVNNTALNQHTQYLLASGAAGNGLGQVGGVLAVNVDNATIQIAADILGVPVGGITNNQLGPLAVGTAKIADGAVTSAKLADGGVATVDLADNAVTTVKITDANVTTAKVANSAVTNAKLADMAANTVKGATAAGAPTDLAFATVSAGLGPYPLIFATTAARDAALPTPAAGQMCVTADTGTIWQYFTTQGWYKTFAVLWRGTHSANIAGIGTGPPPQDLLTSPSIAVPANRRISVHTHFWCEFLNNGAYFAVKMDGVVQAGRTAQFNVLPGPAMLDGESTFTPAAGTHTFTATCAATSGTFNVNTVGEAGYMEVRDWGAV